MVVSCDIVVVSDKFFFVIFGVNIGFFCFIFGVVLVRVVFRKVVLEMFFIGEFIFV